nr:hypothetical protein [uncultured Holophaga sp.]
MVTRRSIDHQRIHGLRNGATAVGIFLLVMIPWRLSRGPGPGPMGLLAMHAGICGVGVLAYALLLHRVPRRIAHPDGLAFGLMVLGLVTTLSQLWLYGRLQETASTLLLALACGGVFGRRRFLAAFEGLLLISWCWVAHRVGGWPGAASWLFDVVLAILFAFALQHLLNRMKAALLQRLERQREALRGLRAALDQVRTLEGLIPICAHCKRIRNDGGYWEHVESYLQARSGAEFTHGICPECTETVRSELQRLKTPAAHQP